MSDAKEKPVRKEWAIELEDAVEHNGGQISELKLRQPTVGELRKAVAELGAVPTKEKEIQMQICIVSLVSGVPRPAIEKMPWPVVVGAAEWLMGFTALVPPTLESSEPS